MARFSASHGPDGRLGIDDGCEHNDSSGNIARRLRIMVALRSPWAYRGLLLDMRGAKASALGVTMLSKAVEKAAAYEGMKKGAPGL